jgi:hypothetical protein
MRLTHQPLHPITILTRHNQQPLQLRLRETRQPNLHLPRLRHHPLFPSPLRRRALPPTIPTIQPLQILTYRVGHVLWFLVSDGAAHNGFDHEAVAAQVAAHADQLALGDAEVEGHLGGEHAFFGGEVVVGGEGFEDELLFYGGEGLASGFAAFVGGHGIDDFR